MDGESDIDGTPGRPPERSALCGSGSARGYADAAPVWQAIDPGGADGGVLRSVGDGQSCGAPMQAGASFLPFKRPRYIIEHMTCHRASEEAGAPPGHCYRVTAIGFGARPATQAVLQTVYRRPE